MSSPFDILKADANGVALGKGAVGNPERLKLTPVEEKDKLAKGKLFRRQETNTYKLGPSQRPVFEHDHGHLADRGMPKQPLRKPTAQDEQLFALMFTRLEVSELMCNERKKQADHPWNNRHRFVKECAGNQPDANLALRNFLFMKGKSRTIDYERCIREEDSAQANPPGTAPAIRTLVNDFILHAEEIGLNREKFSMTGKQMYAIGGKGFATGPTTTNWMRTIGEHNIWISADVAVAVAADGKKMSYEATLTFHIEDMYNFNPNSSDDKLNVKDWEGGQLELSGLGVEFMTYATIYRFITWDEKTPASVKIRFGIPPLGQTNFQEDIAKEEAELWQAQLDARVYGYPSELQKMLNTFIERQSKK
jgi:hypothetical protein